MTLFRMYNTFWAPDPPTAFTPLPALELTEPSEIEALIAPLVVSVFTPLPALFSICDRSIEIEAVALPVGVTKIPEPFSVMVES
jgi:hypothetical protein